MYKPLLVTAVVFFIALLNTNLSFAQGVDYSNIKGRVIMLDPGHGGDDSGAIRHGVKESHLNLAAALNLKKYLEILGAKVIMTRAEDRAVPLNARYDETAKTSPDLFVSLHHNDASDGFYQQPGFKNYTEVYFSALYDGGLENINSGLSFYEAFQKLHGVGSVKLKPGYFKVIRNKKVPSILMEPFFMGEEKLVRRAAYPSYARHEALVYLRAAAEYFNKMKQSARESAAVQPAAIPSLDALSAETFDVFLSCGANEAFLKTAEELLNTAGISAVSNGDNFLDDKNISAHYISKLLTVKDYFEPDMFSAYIEAIRSNSVGAKVHVSLSFDRSRPSAAYAYYKSDNGKKLCEKLIENFKTAGISLEFKPDSFYVLSSTSSVTAVININPDTAGFDAAGRHSIFKANMAVYSAIKTYLTKK